LNPYLTLLFGYIYIYILIFNIKKQLFDIT
jgi:hypothetical protein